MKKPAQKVRQVISCILAGTFLVDKFLFGWQLLHPGQVHILILLPAEILYLRWHYAESIRIQAPLWIGIEHPLHTFGFRLNLRDGRTPGHITFDFPHHYQSNVIICQSDPPKILDGQDSCVNYGLKSGSIDESIHPHLTDLAYLVDKDVKYFRFLHYSVYYRVPQPPGQWLCQFGCSCSSQGFLSSPWLPVRQIWWSALFWCPDGQASCHTQVLILLLSPFQSYLFVFKCHC